MNEAKSRRSGLTRSLLAGVSLGSIALVQVGCAPAGDQQQSAAAAQVQAEARAAGSEEQLCERALATQNYRDVETLLQAYPTGACVPATLAALPPETLSQISPTVLRGMSRPALNRIPPQAAIHMRIPRSSARAGGGGASAAAATGGGAGGVSTGGGSY